MCYASQYNVIIVLLVLDKIPVSVLLYIEKF